MKEKVRSINVGGTQTLLNACVKQGVVGFIYTSSANVVFSGRKELPDLDEDLPYNTLAECVDEYSRTKCTAEQLVISYDGKKLDQENPILHEEIQSSNSAPSSIEKPKVQDSSSQYVGTPHFFK